jgi:hypothetical protein
MIHHPTAFILGAGTSVPYGFPAGEELLRMARGFDLANLKDKAHARAPADVAGLYAALQRTHDSSLDTLLELRSDIAPIGKRLIAALILELEFNSTFPQRYPAPKDDWLTMFFGELTSDTKCLEDFAKNPIVLITYNYDRLLEYRLSRALAAHYGRSDADCIATLGKIPLIHLHGDLGPLPGFAAAVAVPFGPSPAQRDDFAHGIERASERIVIVHETEDFDHARKLLQSVKQVVMLGFGYGASNLSRLDIKRWPKAVYGTQFGLTPSQINYAVTRPFSAAGITVSTTIPAHGTREFLDNSLAIFREV